MTYDKVIETYGFKFHPFPPAATGVAMAGDMWIPNSWSERLAATYDDLLTGSGPKAAAVVGEYGSGKTYVLHWMMKNWFEDKQIQPYYIGNPGLAFYNVADEIFRQIGRYEFSKAVWQTLADDYDLLQPQVSMFDSGFDAWLRFLNTGAAKNDAVLRLAKALQETRLADEEEVAFRFAQMIVGTRDRPYYTFRDFLPRSATSFVAEQQEARYFTALIRIVQYAYGVHGVAFLLDEFEDVALGKRLARRQLSEYNSTLRGLLDTASEEQFWLVLSITPEGWQQTSDQEPALLDRFASRFNLLQLSDEEAVALIQHRLENARGDGPGGSLWPFEESAVTDIQPANRRVPRMLIRIFWLALSTAAQRNVTPPIPNSFVLDAAQRLSEKL